jgi:hypothetical protein
MVYQDSAVLERLSGGLFGIPVDPDLPEQRHNGRKNNRHYGQRQNRFHKR